MGAQPGPCCQGDRGLNNKILYVLNISGIGSGLRGVGMRGDCACVRKGS
jgi:hypothetical protein